MRALLLAAILSVWHPATGWAVYTEDQQRAACGGDVLRFCLLYLADRERISACMIANRAQLTPTCRAVVDDGLAAKRKTR